MKKNDSWWNEGAKWESEISLQNFAKIQPCLVENEAIKLINENGA